MKNIKYNDKKYRILINTKFQWHRHIQWIV